MGDGSAFGERLPEGRHCAAELGGGGKSSDFTWEKWAFLWAGPVTS